MRFRIAFNRGRLPKATRGRARTPKLSRNGSSLSREFRTKWVWEPKASPHRFQNLRCSDSQLAKLSEFLSAPGTDPFERATLRRSVSDEWGKFHFARYQALCFELSFAHQCSRVAPNVAEHKFHRTGKHHGVSVAQSPLRLKMRGGSPDLRLGIEQLKRSFPGALSVKAQRMAVPIREGDLHVPSADQVWRLCLSLGGAAYVRDCHQNQCLCCFHVFA
jgi:hypothetical protein